MERLSFDIDTATDDIKIVRSTGRVKMISGLAEVEQAIRLRLRMWEGERFCKLSDGVPYFRYWEKGTPQELILRDILEEIYADKRVRTVTWLELADFDRKQRTITVDFKAVLVSGEMLDGTRTVNT